MHAEEVGKIGKFEIATGVSVIFIVLVSVIVFSGFVPGVRAASTGTEGVTCGYTHCPCYSCLECGTPDGANWGVCYSCQMDYDDGMCAIHCYYYAPWDVCMEN